MVSAKALVLWVLTGSSMIGGAMIGPNVISRIEALTNKQVMNLIGKRTAVTLEKAYHDYRLFDNLTPKQKKELAEKKRKTIEELSKKFKETHKKQRPRNPWKKTAGGALAAPIIGLGVAKGLGYARRRSARK